MVCSTCVHWNTKDRIESAARCEVILSTRVVVQVDPPQPVMAALYTFPSFGCVLHETAKGVV